MNRQEFLRRLQEGLSVLPREEAKETLSFYNEMIDDRVEAGMSEEAAVAEIGPVDRILWQILGDTAPEMPIAEEVQPKRKRRGWELLLLILGFLLWFPLLMATLAVILALYVCLWSVVISLWAVFGAFVGCALGGALGGIALAIGGHVLTGIALFGAGLVCAGLSIFLFFGCKSTTNEVIRLTKKVLLQPRSYISEKEEGV